MFYFVKSQAFFVLFLYLLYGFKLFICTYCTYVVTPLFSDCPVYIKCFDNKILRPLPLLKFLLPQRKNGAFRLCLSGNNLATHKFSSNAIFASILQAQSPENIEYSTFLGLLYHSNSSADKLNWLFFTAFFKNLLSVFFEKYSRICASPNFQSQNRATYTDIFTLHILN